MQVRKRNGSLVARDTSKIRECVKRACDGLLDVDVEVIVQEAVAQLYDGISTNDIDKATVMAARSRIVYEPNYSFAAARLLLNSIYKEVFGDHVNQRWFEKQYRDVFVTNIVLMEDAGRLDKNVTSRFNLAALAAALKPERDQLFKYMGVQTLYDRYFIHQNQRRLESPQAFWMRVAMGLTYQEDNPTESAIDAYELFSTFRYCPGTPTLFNSATLHPQLSSCYLSTIGDSIDQIFGGIHNQARLSKYAGGLGVSWSSVRGMGGYIKGTNGESQGIIPWLKLFNDTLIAVNQGGKRRGAGCAYLEPNHIDFQDFLELRKNTGDDRRRTHDMHTAAWIPDEFMKRVKANDVWYMFSPDDCPWLHELSGPEFSIEYARCIELTESGDITNFQKMNAKDLWRKILTAILETGHPWITFKCPSNLRYSNSHAGVVHSSNLCTEILLHTSETQYNDEGERTEPGETAVCNLGSVNLAAHLDYCLDSQGGKWQIDYDKLADTVGKAQRLLDNVVDINFYPTPESLKANTTHRPVGLGLMGWHDVLHAFQLEFESADAADLRSKVQEFISYNAIIASASLAGERGCYPSYHGSTWSRGKLPLDTYHDLMAYRGQPSAVKIHWPDLEQQARDCIADNGMRNSNVMAIAPTATISFILGCSQSIEPDFSTLFVNTTLSGEFTMISTSFVERMKSLGVWSEDFANQVIRNDGDVSSLDIPDEIKREFKTAFQVDQFKLIDSVAAAQVWIDMGQSMNLYAATKGLKALNDLYFHAWEAGLKTTYYLRTMAASKIEKSTQHKLPKVDIIDEPVVACSISNPNCESCQ